MALSPPPSSLESALRGHGFEVQTRLQSASGNRTAVLGLLAIICGIGLLTGTLWFVAPCLSPLALASAVMLPGVWAFLARSADRVGTARMEEAGLRIELAGEPERFVPRRRILGAEPHPGGFQLMFADPDEVLVLRGQWTDEEVDWLVTATSSLTKREFSNAADEAQERIELESKQLKRSAEKTPR